MARTLYLENGSTEYIFAGETEQDKLQKIIREHLGRDCEELYEEVIAELKDTDPEDYERVADGYHGMLMDTMNSLEEALAKPRLDRKRIERIAQNLCKNL